MENQLQNCSSSFWDNSSIDSPLDPAFSSMVSSPMPNPPNLLRELIGRLGTVCNSNSSPNFPIPFDPGFPRFNNPSPSVQESRGKFPNPFAPDNVEFADSRENSSSISDQIPPPNSRKRKSSITPNPKPSPKPCVASENSESGAKRSKSEEANEKDKNNKTSSSSSSKDNNNKNKAAAAAEAPKDYIHVRARRGQATDAHSLAERVRREKISERMKVLQDLVPGCNKVTGKAVMLDEIINYVQSLQRQVEFLSMKLANIEGSVSNIYHHPIDPNLHIIPEGIGLGRNQIHNFGETSASQVYWEDDLHSFVQMGYGQTNNNTHGGIGMKVEL